MVTGFDYDNQVIAKEHVRALNRLSAAIEKLVQALEQKEKESLT